MNIENNLRRQVVVNALAFTGVFLTLAALIALMYHYAQPAPLDQAHWTERQKNLAELKAQNAEALDSYGWVDQSRGAVRLPVDRALELTILEWQNPDQGRSNMLARLERLAPAVPSAKTNAPAVGLSK